MAVTYNDLYLKTRRALKDSGVEACALEARILLCHAMDCTKEQLLSRGQGAFLDCMIPYSHISSESQPWRLAWVHFAGRSLPGYYAYFQNVHPTPFLTLPEPERHEAILSQLLSLTKEPGAGAELQVSDLLHRLVTLLITGSNTAPREQDKLEQVRKYLDEHYAEDVTLDSLAQTFYLSRFYLSRSFSERFHMTLKEYLLGRRITAAKALLRFTALPIQEVARTCGIPDANYFSKVFQKLEGVTERTSARRSPHAAGNEPPPRPLR